MHKYWCHKTEALKVIVKRQSSYFHSGPGFLTRNTVPMTRLTYIFYHSAIEISQIKELSNTPHIIEQIDYFQCFSFDRRKTFYI